MHSTLPQQHRPGLEAQLKVLLVDDDAVSLEILALMLGFAGHDVVRASDGESALALLAHPDSSVPPDVLLVDMQMPGLSGYELAQRIRAMKGPAPLLLAMSATNLSAGQMRGFDGFLTKPLDLDDLREALEPLNTIGTGRRESSSAGEAPRAFRAKSARPRTGGVLAPEGGQGPMARKVSNSAANSVPQQSLPRGQAQPINQNVLDKLRSAMPAEALRRLYAACLEDSRRRAAEVRVHIEDGRPAEARREAHQIKGAASMVGAERIAQLASALESGSSKEEHTLALANDLLNACDELERILLAGKIEKYL